MPETNTIKRALVFAAAFAASQPLLAAKPGSTGVTGEIHGPYATAEAAEVESSVIGTWPAYGDGIFFDVVINGDLNPKQDWVYVTLICVNDAGDFVFQASNWTDYAFTLVDLAGQGLEWRGEPATCSATLIKRTEKGKSAEITYLSDVEFEVAGSTR